MKKIWKVLFTIIACFILAGCGEAKPEDEPINNSETDNIKLYSDDKKIVYDYSGVYKLVFYYEENEITGYELYYEYETVDLAKYAKDALETQYNNSVESVLQKGRYIIVTYSEDTYKDLTVDMVKTSYSHLKEVTKEDSCLSNMC